MKFTAWISAPTPSAVSLESPRFHFVEGDISIHSEWIEYHIKKCDVVLPLVAIATPIEYTPQTRCACSSWISKRT